MATRLELLLSHLSRSSTNDVCDSSTALLCCKPTSSTHSEKVGVILAPEVVDYLSANHPDLLTRIDPIFVNFKGELVDPSKKDALERALIYVRTEGSNAQATERVLGVAKSLVWMHSPSAGVDFLLKSQKIAQGVRAPNGPATRQALEEMGGGHYCLTNTPGATAIPIAEFVLMYMLFWVKKGHELRTAALPRSETGNPDDASGKNWWRTANIGLAKKIGELHGSTVLIWGFGSIGQEVGKRCRAFGMRVIGTRRNVNPEGILEGSYDELIGDDGWRELLPQADYFVICAPLTAQTKGSVDKALLGKMKRGVFVINIARGGIVNDADLVAAINSGHVAGAALVG